MEKLLSDTVFNDCLYASPGRFFGYIFSDERAINLSAYPSYVYRTLDGWVKFPYCSKLRGFIWLLNIPAGVSDPSINRRRDGYLEFFNDEKGTYELIRAKKISRTEFRLKGLFL